MRLHIWTGTTVFLAAYTNHVAASGPARAEQKTSTGLRETAPTCVSGSINYITHKLPQQCASSTRVPSIRSAESTAGPQVTSGGEHAAPQATGTYQTSTPSTTPSKDVPGASAGHDKADSPASTQGLSSDQSKIQELATAAGIPSSSSSTSSAGSASTEVEESPLDTANFLSFEEWKKKNLAQAGQSPEHIGQPRSSEDLPKRPRPGASNALDVLGEDTEIELDFTGFGATTNPQQAPAAHKLREKGVIVDSPPSDKPTSQQTIRSKDAGRTCKERTNYASFDCAATVLKTNPECKSASSVLVENKDSYMLNICSVENKFFIVELCDDILIDTVVLANYEFFSSIFRNFRLSVSDRYPAKPDKWKELGVFEARNTRQVQPFLVEQPLIWARYLRIEILSHYGNEYYCPVSLLRVHGTTMVEEFRHQEEIARGEYPEEPLIEEPAAGTASPLVAQEPARSSIPADHSTLAAPIEHATDSSAVQESDHLTHVPLTTHEGVQDPDQTPAASEPSSSVISNDSTPWATNHAVQTYVNATAVVTNRPTSRQDFESDKSSEEPMHSSPVAVSHKSGPDHASTGTSYQTSDNVADTSTTDSPEQGEAKPTASPHLLGHPSSLEHQAASALQQSVSAETSGVAEQQSTNPSIKSTSSSAGTPGTSPSAAQNESESATSAAVTHSQQSSAPVVQVASSVSTAPRRPTPSQPQPATPSTQESFIKTLHKRLSALESNASLSLQYIEHQSLLLRDAFSSHSKSQSSRTTAFLTSLNATVHAELVDFRKQYDDLWQSTVIELDGQRKSWEREVREVREVLRGVERLAGEVGWQRRMVVVQSTLILLCLGLILFSRGGGYHSGGNSSGSGGYGGVTGWDIGGLMMRGSSPPMSPRGPSAGGSRYEKARRSWSWRRSPSPLSDKDNENDEDAMRWNVRPPTPCLSSPGKSDETAGREGDDGSGGDDDGTGDAEDESFEASTPELGPVRESVEGGMGIHVDAERLSPSGGGSWLARTQSSPAMATGTRDADVLRQ